MSDQPESDQHISLPIISQERFIEREALYDNSVASDENLAIQEGNLSSYSLDSDVFFSDLVFSESPSPVAFDHIVKDRSSSLVEDWRSCPELDKEGVGSLTNLSHIDMLEFSQKEKMPKSISKSAHTLKVVFFCVLNM